MRTNIEIDAGLLEAAMSATGLPTKRATVEEGLRRIVAEKKRRDAIIGSADIGWEGDLDTMRRDKSRKRR